MIALAKMANLRALRGDRDAALATYGRAETLAEQAVAALPNDTDASRDLSIVYGMHAMFLSDGGACDSALVVYERAMKIAEQLAAADPSSALPQSDLASGHFELGGILAKGGRHEGAERRFGEAYERFARLAAADTANVDDRIYMARSSREAGKACEAMARGAATPDQRSRCRARARTWFGRSLDLYRSLEKSGALAGEEAAAPAELDRAVAGLRKDG
jgi:tetratricopeptide (TPR) repeat protein